MKILVIEDDKELLYTLKIILKAEGFEVDTAETFRSGKSQISENHYDLVITDIMLPYWGGFDLVDAVKENAESAKTPVIVITGMDEEVLSSTHTYAEKCLVKPFNKHVLLEAVNTLLYN